MELKNNQWNVLVITGWRPDDMQLIGNTDSHYEAWRILVNWSRERVVTRTFHETIEDGKTTFWQEGATKGVYNQCVGFVKWVSSEGLPPVYDPEFDGIALAVLDGDHD